MTDSMKEQGRTQQHEKKKKTLFTQVKSKVCYSPQLTVAWQH